MSVSSFLIKCALEEVHADVEQKLDPQWASVLGASVAGLPVSAAGAGLSSLAVKHVMKDPSKPATARVYAKLQKAMGGEGVPYHGTPGYRAGGAWVPPHAINLAKRFPQLRSALQQQTGADMDGAIRAAHPEHGVIIGLPLHARAPKTPEFKPSGDPFENVFRRMAEDRKRLADRLDRIDLRGSKKMSPVILAHELGHATGLRPIRGAVGNLGSAFAMGLGPAAGAIYAGYQADPEDSAVSAVGKGALRGAGASLLMGSPRLAEELRASVRGWRGLRSIGHPNSGAAAKMLAAAFSTYFLKSLVGGTTRGMVGGAIGRSWKRHKMNDPQAEETATAENG